MYRKGRNCAEVCTHCRILGTPRRIFSDIPVIVTTLSRRTLTLIERAGLFRKVKDKVIIRGPNGRHAVPVPRQDRQAGEVIRFGFFGRIEPIKGLELLLEAMRHVPTDRARLLIGGRAAPAYLEHLRSSYPAPNVEFLGFVDPGQFFPMIDVLVVPSLWEEPLTRVTNEGLAYGVPTVAARVGGLAEIVDEGKTGWLFPGGDAAALAAILQRIVMEGLPAARMFESCRERSADFEFPVIFDQYLTVLRRAVAGRAPG
jgi:glycosyltransferase involved in cell wall biosynthesis